MNAISIDERLRSSAVLAAARMARGKPIGIAPADLPVEWLPAPAARGVCRAQKSCKPAVRSKVAWVTPPSQTALEKFFFGLLTLAAIIGIGYGVVCLIDLVQNWAAVNMGIRNLI